MEPELNPHAYKKPSALGFHASTPRNPIIPFMSKRFSLHLLAGIGLFIAVCNANNNSPSPLPLQNYTLPSHISLDRVFTIDPSILTAPDSSGGTNCTAPNQSLIRDGSVSIVLPSPLIDNSTEALESYQDRTFNDSLPYLLEQIGVKPECIPKLVAKGVPLFKAVINDAINLDGPDTNGSIALRRRGIFDDIGNFFEDVGEAIVDVGEEIVGGVVNVATGAACDVFAAAALPGYHASVALFAALNAFNTPRSTTADQNFYINPLHGNIFRDGIRIYYNARFAPGFGNAIGVTMGRAIYMRAGRVVDVSQPEFPTVTRTLLHEFTHTKQYRTFGYDLSAFGLRYLYNYCKAGFNYENNAMEKEARAKAAEMNTLLGPVGLQFLRIWKARGLGARLGLPTAKTFTRTFVSGVTTIFSLRLQGGRMSIVCRGTGASLTCN